MNRPSTRPNATAVCILALLAALLLFCVPAAFAQSHVLHPGAEVCDDGVDNDRDGRIDCRDRDCRRSAECPRETRMGEGWGRTCADGRDNDRDGLVDCDDPDCADNRTCTICICTDLWDPVCGADGRTYPNECEAACAEVDVAYHGECADPTVCEGIAGFPCPEGFTCNLLDPTCSISDLAGVCVPTPDACPRIYAPVCGCDGVTYPNDCERLLAGATLAHRGECGCSCPEIWDPVCGVDGRTYPNACEAKCAGVDIAYRGECGKMCGGIAGFPCPDGEVCNYVDPTCSIVDLAGTCVPKPDACPEMYAPVCGCDGVTYPNDCYRIRAGATLAHRGECKKESCDDGSVLLCLRPTPICPPGTVLAVQNNCYVCADPVTCEPVPY